MLSRIARQFRTLTWKSGTGFQQQLILLRGKLRRIYLVTFRKEYVKKSLERRNGECRRCGWCCHLLVRCCFLKGEGESTSCRINNLKNGICTSFPIDERDIRDRNIQDTEGKCGYWFESK
jgi:hypothetical protein